MFNDAVLLTKQNGIATITLNRPEANNALNGDVFNGWVWALQQCFDESIRAVVVTGAGNKAFCFGGDLAFASQYEGGDLPAFFRDYCDPVARIASDIRKLPKPVIASINGLCVGAGISFAAACDIRICHSEVIFKQGYTSVGLCQDCGFSQMVPAILGFGRTSEMIFLDEVIPAAKALEWGLVNIVVPPEELAAETNKIAAKLAKGATKAFAASKALLNRSLMPYLQSQLELERELVMDCARTEDYREGIAVFTGQKKKAEFQGR